MAYLAGTIVNNVRDAFPDPTYNGVIPQPDADGPIFRAATLYRWLDDGVRLMASRLGGTFTDWTAFPAVANKALYEVSPLWQVIDQAYASKFRCKILSQAEADNIYPGSASGEQPKQSYVFRMTDHIDMGFDPIPNYTDPSTTLAGAITPTSTLIVLAGVGGWLPSGYAILGSELIAYQIINGNTLEVVARGQGGTTAAEHAAASVATHCSLWIKGARVPVTISGSTSVVEMPLGWVSLLNAYLLGMMRQSEQEFQVAGQLLQQFEKGCDAIAQERRGRDPITRRLGDDRQTGGVPPPFVSEPAQIQSSG